MVRCDGSEPFGGVRCRVGAKKKNSLKRKKFLEIVSKSLEDKPNESYRRLTLRLSKEHGRIGKTTLWRIKRKDLQMYPYRQKKVQKVTKPSANLRLSYCVKISTFKDDCIFFENFLN